MCDPLSIASAMFSAVGKMQETEAQNQQASYNAAIARNNATLSEYKAVEAQARGEEEATAQARKTAQLRGDQRATLAARGLDLGEGTAAALVDQTDYFGQVDQNTIRLNAAKEGYTNRVQGQNYTTQASQFEASKKSPMMAGISSMLSSASQVDSKWDVKSTPAASTWSGTPANSSFYPVNPNKGWA